MKKRKHLFISGLLLSLAVLQPLRAAPITPADANTQLQAGKVPVVAIATPNTTGVSHNRYLDFNVGASGAVLNNATVAGTSQLAGSLNANSNLNQHAATLIINEVTGANRSVLNGQLEVFGRDAPVIIANPGGISCDGCSFINTPGLTLTTGTPQFNAQGGLAALEATRGSIVIGSKGLDASTQNYVDILSQAIEINGPLQAQTLSLIPGANRQNYADGSITRLESTASAPQLRVDCNALGSIHANKIHLIGTQEGLGVNQANLPDSTGRIILSDKGDIQLDSSNTASSSKVSHIDANRIRFSQNSVSFYKTDRESNEAFTYNGLMENMKKDGWQGAPIDVVKMPDGILTSMDNTRVTAARQAGIAVQANVLNPNDPLPENMVKYRRFEDKKTWGEAIQHRIEKQGKKFNKHYPNGSFNSPKIKQG